MKINTAPRVHLTLVRMTKSTKQWATNAGEAVDKEEPSFTVGVATPEISVENPQKTKSKSTIGLTYIGLGTCLKALMLDSTDIFSAMFIVFYS